MNASKKSLLLDSSVLVKLFHQDEADVDMALLLRSGHMDGHWEIRLADLSFYELANALYYIGKYPAKEIIEGIQSLLALELHIYSFDARILHAGLGLCAEKKISIYDSYLVALTKHENLVFVTADEKLARKFQSDPDVIMLSQLSSELDEEE